MSLNIKSHRKTILLLKKQKKTKVKEKDIVPEEKKMKENFAEPLVLSQENDSEELILENDNQNEPLILNNIQEEQILKKQIKQKNFISIS